MRVFELPYQYRIMKRYGIETTEIIRVNELISNHNLLFNSRKKELVFKRQIIMWYLRINTSLSLSEIGKMLGGKDHATVLHGYKVVKNYLEYKDKYFKEVVDEINQELRAIFTIKAF